MYDIAEFHQIVPSGPRSLLVQRLHLVLKVQSSSLRSRDYPPKTSPATVVAEVLGQVFDTLRGWDDRPALDDARLLEFCLEVGGDRQWAISSNLSRLPQVPVIGRILISPPVNNRKGWLHASSAKSLLRRAPNVWGTNIILGRLPTTPGQLGWTEGNDITGTVSHIISSPSYCMFLTPRRLSD